MIYLITFLWALPSGIVWLFNAEVLVVTQVTTSDAAPWLIAVLVTVGQFIGYATLYLAADRFLARLTVVKRAVSKVEVRQPGWGTWLLFGTGGLVGIPPLLALFAVYGSARVGRLPLLLLCAIPGRLTWYFGWAYAPDFLRDTFGWFG